jgi:hypothetical protein
MDSSQKTCYSTTPTRWGNMWSCKKNIRKKYYIIPDKLFRCEASSKTFPLFWILLWQICFVIYLTTLYQLNKYVVVFWHVTPCIDVVRYHRSEGPLFRVKMERALSFKTLVSTATPWIIFIAVKTSNVSCTRDDVAHYLRRRAKERTARVRFPGMRTSSLRAGGILLTVGTVGAPSWAVSFI